MEPDRDTLLPIGAFARLTYLTVKALRLYAQLGLLVPVHVDAASGYRYYHPEQVQRARPIRLMRAMQMPLGTIHVVLSADAASAALLTNAYVQSLRSVPSSHVDWLRASSPHQPDGLAPAACPRHHHHRPTPRQHPACLRLAKRLPPLLMDEVITYVSTCRRKGYGTALYNFLHALSETVTAEPNVVLVASIPASELEYTAEDIADEQRFKKMLDRRGKAYVMSAESETAEIIRRRLFEWDLRSVGQHGRAAVARSQARGRVAIVIADNLRTHTAAGSRLVRQMLAELHGQLYLVYTPAYDPDANRIEWLWRISRRAVSHNHQREIWDELQADIVQHFILLSEQPDVVLRHLGSAFAEEWGRTPAVCSAA